MKAFLLLSTILLNWVLPVSAPAQELANSEISGRITLNTGVAATGARIVAQSVPGGILYGSVTDTSGRYRIPNVEIGGPYEVRVNLSGYKPVVRKEIFLTYAKPCTVDAELEPLADRKSAGPSKPGKAVVVLSMDGFRWDYPEVYRTPNLDRMARQGCKAVSLKPSYPSKTFPNHYAIATGLYPDHNGIVQNSFYDPRLDRVFRMGDRSAVEDSVFWQGEAIWETAEKQGLRTASYFWVGSETNARYRPEKRKMYESGFPFRQQIDTVFKWLSMPASERPDLLMFYFDEPDKTSHAYGPVSPQTRQTVRHLDRLVGTLLKGLNRIHRKSGLDIDLIILSDHGMGYIPESNEIFLEDILDLSQVKRINGGNPVINIEPRPGALDSVYNQLKAAPHLKVWKKEDLPAKYHYGTHYRIPELIVEADSAYGLEIRRKKGDGHYSLGMHGYDPDNRDMHGIFYAKGPSFKRDYSQPTFPNVDIYDLLARILGIKPAPNDGDFSDVKGMLRND